MDEKRILKWSTASESNNDYFMIEQSLDGVYFDQIGSIDGAGNSTSLLNYEFDISNEKGDYFRLRQVDFDGVFAITDVINVDCKTENEDVVFYPNPFEDELTIEFTSGENEDLIVQFFDMNGKMLLTQEIERTKKIVQLRDGLSLLSKGFYFVEIRNLENSKLIKKVKVVKL